MKLKGQTLQVLARREVTIPRDGGGITVTVQAMPLGGNDDIDELFPSPKPPRTFVTGRDKLPIRDQQGKPLVAEDLNDARYLSEVRASNRRKVAWNVFHSIVPGASEMQFETVKPAEMTQDSAAAFADAVFEELRAAGFSIGDLNVILEAVMEASNLREETMTRAKEGFSSGG